MVIKHLPRARWNYIATLTATEVIQKLGVQNWHPIATGTIELGTNEAKPRNVNELFSQGIQQAQNALNLN